MQLLPPNPALLAPSSAAQLEQEFPHIASLAKSSALQRGFPSDMWSPQLEKLCVASVCRTGYLPTDLLVPSIPFHRIPIDDELRKRFPKEAMDAYLRWAELGEQSVFVFTRDEHW